jgi:hypothetical protein
MTTPTKPETAMTEFTAEEIETAKEVRDTIIDGSPDELKSIYMAGEIVGTTETRSQLLPVIARLEEEKLEFIKYIKSCIEHYEAMERLAQLMPHDVIVRDTYKSVLEQLTKTK